MQAIVNIFDFERSGASEISRNFNFRRFRSARYEATPEKTLVAGVAN
jgi:hypothetical protein